MGFSPYQRPDAAQSFNDALGSKPVKWLYFGDTSRYHSPMAMTLRLTAAETEALRETARREHRSMQEVARSAIDEYVTRRARRRDDHLAAIVREDAELLQRLGGS